MRRAVIGRVLMIGIAVSGLVLLLGCPSRDDSNAIVTKRIESTAPVRLNTKVEAVVPEEAEQAKRQVELAIRAHGGNDNLSRMRSCFICRQIGQSTPPGQIIPTDREWQISFPERIYVTVTLPNQSPSVEWCSESGGWLRLGASTNELPADMLDDLRTQLYIFSLFTIRPLRNEEFVLKPLPDTTVQGRPAKAIKVMQKDHPQIELDFDAQTNLLVRIFMQRKLPQVNALMDHQILLSQHKGFEGIQLPTHWIESNDGQVRMNLDNAEYRFPAEIPAKVFEKPE